MGVLDGTRVIDFGRYIAGPYCGALLGDLGAEVIRVERVEGGEDRWITPVTSDGVGAMYLQCNRGKRGMTLDVSQARGPGGRRPGWSRTADVVIANLPGRDAAHAWASTTTRCGPSSPTSSSPP